MLIVASTDCRVLRLTTTDLGQAWDTAITINRWYRISAESRIVSPGGRTWAPA